MKWIVHYGCGCTADAPRKKDLLEYCGQHGDDAAEWIKVPPPSSYVRDTMRVQGAMARVENQIRKDGKI